MRETLLVVGLVVLAVALRSCRRTICRKLGALSLLAASFFLVYFLSGSILGGVAGAAGWFFLPWVELLTRIRRLRLPLDNRLRYRVPPSDAFFPNATEAVQAMEEEGFEHATDSGWEWAGMKQYFRIYWNPEKSAVAMVCLCEQEDVAFAYISVTSRDESGSVWRTTNFPFSPTLKCSPEISWNHVPCERNCFHQILKDHGTFLRRRGVRSEDLRVPDPDDAEREIETEMRDQIDHNLASGIIRLTGDGHFRYSLRGLFFLWKQFIKDMVRLC
ncbi:MAG: hypothetical protein HKN82_19860 [Akkermansiaceae bacterium]|nr:hypothetical protein [Akkermansiaceae bacterium]NNM29212.1 hypothetical protein [Akkermansiaceae bacterium]